MIAHAVLTVTYAPHGPDHRTLGRWDCLLCDARSRSMLWASALGAADTHVTLTHGITSPCLRIRDRGRT